MKNKLLLLVFLLSFIVSGCSKYTINQSYTDNSILINEIKLELVKCPAGTFRMGATSKEESYSYKDEFNKESVHKKIYGFDYSENLHSVKISKPFYIGKYEVTQEQYIAVMGENPSHFKDSNKPVEMVCWYDAKVFCEKLNEKSKDSLPNGYKFSLPTEAQWEYACRAKTDSLFNNGKDIYNLKIDEILWNDKNANGTTHIVGQKKPNAWGIYDMHGNVWEWCNDWYGEYPNYDVIDPVGADSGYFKVFRGGGWYSDGIGCRSANRRSIIPERKLICLGFRLALIPVELDDIRNAVKDKFASKLINIKATGKTWKLKDLNLEMVECPAGNFIMGSPFLEYLDTRFNTIGYSCEKGFGFLYNETQHLVNISKPFYIGKFEITQNQYEKVMGENPSISKDANKPVDRITWNKAKEFCSKLNSQYATQLPKGFKFDLPTEAQWEYACRAGTNTSINNGKNITTLEGKCSNLSEVAWFGEKVEVMPHKVGQKKPNAWGIYDMHGNVLEWCNDLFGDYTIYEETDPTGVTKCNIRNDDLLKELGDSFRVIRGGCFCWPPNMCRSGFRYFYAPDKNPNSTGKDDFFVGFRVALVPVE